MPTRSQVKIRRDINRLKTVVDRNIENHPALAAVKSRVDSAAELVNERWRGFQQMSVSADKERSERDTAIDRVRGWVQRWRPVVLLTVPGAGENIRALPPSGTTPDDMLRVAEDLSEFIASNPGAAEFRDAARSDMGGGIESARTEAFEASAALPAESAARAAYTEATISANAVLVRGSEVVRAIFGPRSPEYKQFIARASADEEAEEAAESATGEEPDAVPVVNPVSDATTARV